MKQYFDGDIIITDPCYIMNPNNKNDWQKCDYADNLEIFGITTYICRDTIYGDWSCTVFDEDTGEDMGDFCADAGMVAVLDLDEVHKYNPDFDWYKSRPWTTTLIKNYKGYVELVVVNGEVQVVGYGVDKVTGYPINFVGRQTSL